ncbi:MAG: hypothetical protein ACI9AR_000183 [Flavobacteriaceae bacterium]|jgi:uncharacterized protein (TIGR00730 family)
MNNKEYLEYMLDHIEDEFKGGFEKIFENPSWEKSVTFWGSARFKEGNKYYEMARSLASRVATELDYAVVTGGGGGIMEAGNRGAYEADGESVGFNIKLPFEQILNPYTTDSYTFDHFYIRKVLMSYGAEAYIYFPGGFGTLDELFEMITLIQTKKIPPVPVVLMGSEYWQPLDDFIKKTLLEDNKTISPEDLELYTISDDLDEVMEIIKNAPNRNR